MPISHFHGASLVDQTASALLEAIYQGEFVGTLPGENQLSESLNVSRHTLRRALAILVEDGYLEIAKGKKTRILKHADKSSRKHSKTVCFISAFSWHSLQNSTKSLIHQFREKLATEGIRWEEFFDPEFNVSSQTCRELIKQRPNACWVLISATHAMQRFFQEADENTIVIGTCHPGVELPSIDWDFNAIGFHAGGIFSRNNHHRIALIRPKVREEPAGDVATKSGLLSSFKKMPSSELQLIDIQAAPSLAEFRIAFERLMSSPNRPTAIFTYGHDETLTVLTLALQLGIRIPEELSLLARADHPILCRTIPQVSRYERDSDKLIRTTLRLLRKMLEGQRLPVTPCRLIPQLTPGETLAKAPDRSSYSCGNAQSPIPQRPAEGS